MMSDEKYAGWVILELMGHRRLGGYLTEQEIGGGVLLRLDVPAVDGRPAATQLYGIQSVYCITPTTEEVATLCARSSQRAPVQRWELPAAKPEDLDPQLHIRALQDSLRSHGFDPGPTDGVCGDKTIEALREFQQHRWSELEDQGSPV